MISDIAFVRPNDDNCANKEPDNNDGSNDNANNSNNNNEKEKDNYNNNPLLNKFRV